jgi:hypothetical protein
VAVVLDEEHVGGSGVLLPRERPVGDPRHVHVRAIPDDPGGPVSAGRAELHGPLAEPAEGEPADERIHAPGADLVGEHAVGRARHEQALLIERDAEDWSLPAVPNWLVQIGSPSRPNLATNASCPPLLVRPGNVASVKPATYTPVSSAANARAWSTP